MLIVDRVRCSYKVNRMVSITRYALLWMLAMMRRVNLSSKIGQRRELHINFGCGNVYDARFLILMQGHSITLTL